MDKQQISSIEKEAKEIKGNINKYKKTEKFKDETGNKYVYKHNNELKFVSVYFEDTDANKTVEWYFTNGQLLYSHKVWTDKKTNKVVTNEKCFLHGGHLVGWTKDDNPVEVTSEEFERISQELIAYGTKLIEESK